MKPYVKIKNDHSKITIIASPSVVGTLAHLAEKHIIEDDSYGSADAQAFIDEFYRWVKS
jgi:hypothetical protein